MSRPSIDQMRSIHKYHIKDIGDGVYQADVGTPIFDLIMGTELMDGHSEQTLRTLFDRGEIWCPEEALYLRLGAHINNVRDEVYEIEVGDLGKVKFKGSFDTDRRLEGAPVRRQSHD